ncbi:hypothetical protein HY642_05280 [Candidatus Woesearchaeota archaeon]|nr:hypothetical protein [Candidatus Woesearchaeota archaeon]
MPKRGALSKLQRLQQKQQRELEKLQEEAALLEVQRQREMQELREKKPFWQSTVKASLLTVPLLAALAVSLSTEVDIEDVTVSTTGLVIFAIIYLCSLAVYFALRLRRTP